MQVFLQDGTASEKVVEYPLGHSRRRAEGLAALAKKLLANLRTRFPEKRVQQLLEISQDQEKLASMAVSDFVELFIG